MTSATIVQNSAGARFELRDISCPTCGPGSTRFLGLRGGKHHRYGLGTETRIVQCTRCTLVFPNPFPYPVEPWELYGDPVEYFGSYTVDLKIQACRSLVREIQKRTRKQDPRVLDVGCGRGELLQAGRLEGLSTVIGLELSRQIAEAAEAMGVRVYQHTIEDFARTTEERFDAIVLAAVIEHVHDPDSMMAAAARLAAPGAVLYFDTSCEPHLVASVGNAVNRLTGSRACYNLAPTWPPYHVFGFNPKALRLLFEKHGFSLEEIHVHSSPEIPAQHSLKDRLRSFVATQIGRVANITGRASNMHGWARRV
jgi:SAM-dependent methyltransferase